MPHDFMYLHHELCRAQVLRISVNEAKMVTDLHEYLYGVVSNVKIRLRRRVMQI